MAHMQCRFAAFRAVSKACMLWRLSMDDLQVCPPADVLARPAARLIQCCYFPHPSSQFNIHTRQAERTCGRSDASVHAIQHMRVMKLGL